MQPTTSLYGKTVTGIAVPDDQADYVVFMLSDGSALGMSVGIQQSYLNGPSGLRLIQGVTAFLGHTITAVIDTLLPANQETIIDQYANFMFRELSLVTSNGTLVIKYLLNPGASPATLEETSPTANGVLTGDYTMPTPFQGTIN